MLEQPETSPLEMNLRFVKVTWKKNQNSFRDVIFRIFPQNEAEDQLNEMFTESQKQQSRAPFKMIKPYPGMNERPWSSFFIN